jgi:uncharacterized protein (DUF1330 family)
MAMDKKAQAAHDEAVAAYLAKGGKVTVCEKDARTENLVTNIWKRGPGRPKKADAEKNEE